jgi:hypothetical protein
MLISEIKLKVSNHSAALRELDTETVLKTLYEASCGFAEN